MIPGRFARLLLLLGALAVLPSAVAAQPPPSPAPQPSPPPLAIPGTVVANVDGVNIRACPRAECEIRGVAKFGERVTVTGEAVDGFVPVERDGVRGYAFALYVATPDRTPELRQGLPGCNRVAIIFNLGVGYENRTEILDRLKADGVPATVFPMGWWAEEHPEVLQRIAKDGFPIGSHGDQRVALTERTDVDVTRDVRDAAAAIERATGEKPVPYFTPYAAASDERVRALVARAGYLPVLHYIAAADWDFGADPDAIWERVVPNVTDGAIIEFHLDAPASAEGTGVALPWIVERLKAKGYRFVTVPEMAQPCADPAAAAPATAATAEPDADRPSSAPPPSG